MTARSLVALLASAALLMPSIAPAIGLSGSATMRARSMSTRGRLTSRLKRSLGNYLRCWRRQPGLRTTGQPRRAHWQRMKIWVAHQLLQMQKLLQKQTVPFCIRG